MFGGGSIQLGRVFGIRVGVDISWFFALFLIIFTLGSYYEDVAPGTSPFVLATISALLFFLSILLHEFGHATVAIRNGIPIQGIDLWLFGGVAKLGRDSDSPGVEFRIAVAGPVVTLVIAAICIGLGALISSPSEVIESSQFEDTTSGATLAVLGYLASINIIVLVFNLIPGFPLDGGRIARAIVWKITGDRNRATRFAGQLGRYVGWALVGFGIFMAVAWNDVIGGIWFAFIGFFLSQAAGSAVAQADFSDRLVGISVADVMDAEPVAIPDVMAIDQALQEFFMRYGWPWFPVVDGFGRLVGVVSQEAIASVPEHERHTRTVASVMARDDGDTGLRARVEDPLEDLLSRDGLSRLGAVMAVDGEGVLRGIVTVEAVQRALRSAAPA